MGSRSSDRDQTAETQAAQRFRELLRQDHARDVRWAKDQAKRRAKLERKAARLDTLVRTAEARIARCKDYPTPHAVLQMRRIVDDTTKPARIRVEAAALILSWAE
jgi:hypothetical protein